MLYNFGDFVNNFRHFIVVIINCHYHNAPWLWSSRNTKGYQSGDQCGHSLIGLQTPVIIYSSHILFKKALNNSLHFINVLEMEIYGNRQNAFCSNSLHNKPKLSVHLQHVTDIRMFYLRKIISGIPLDHEYFLSWTRRTKLPLTFFFIYIYIYKSTKLQMWMVVSNILLSPFISNLEH